jgi:hypothetical protein
MTIVKGNSGASGTAIITLAERRKATAALPVPKLAPGVNMRTISMDRLPLAGLEDDASGKIGAFVFDPPGTHSGFDLPTLIYFHGGWFKTSQANEPG